MRHNCCYMLQVCFLLLLFLLLRQRLLICLLQSVHDSLSLHLLCILRRNLVLHLLLLFLLVDSVLLLMLFSNIVAPMCLLLLVLVELHYRCWCFCIVLLECLLVHFLSRSLLVCSILHVIVCIIVSSFIGSLLLISHIFRLE